MNMNEWTVYSWPESQLCMDCINSSEEILAESAKRCIINCKENDGVNCPFFSEMEKNK